VGGGRALGGYGVLFPGRVFTHRLEALRHDAPRLDLVEQGRLYRLAGALTRWVQAALSFEVAQRSGGRVGILILDVAWSVGGRLGSLVDQGKRGRSPQAR